MQRFAVVLDSAWSMNVELLQPMPSAEACGVWISIVRLTARSVSTCRCVCSLQLFLHLQCFS